MKNALNAGAAGGSEHGLPASGFVARLRYTQRQRLFQAFRLFRQDGADDTVLSLYMQAGPGLEGGDYLTAWSAAQERAHITSREVPAHGPGEACQRLPFADGSFDWIFCSEVIEHAGPETRQAALVTDLYRIARKGLFITTPNRRHPLDFHTGLPLLHWLPSWRRRSAQSGKAGRAAAALHLLDAPALYRMAEALPGRPVHDVGHKRVFGIKAHFFLMIQKESFQSKERAENPMGQGAL